MIKIQVVGTGCPTCERLEKLCAEVIEELNLQAEIEKVTDINDFGTYGIFITPGLVINGKPVLQGKLPTKHTLAHWLTDYSKQ